MHLLLEGDSVTIVSRFTSLSMHKYSHNPLLQCICHWVNSISSFHVHHIYWVANQVTDFLATKALSGNFTWATNSDVDLHCTYPLDADVRMSFILSPLILYFYKF